MKGGDMNLEMQTDTLRFVVKSKPHKVPCTATELRVFARAQSLRGLSEVQRSPLGRSWSGAEGTCTSCAKCASGRTSAPQSLAEPRIATPSFGILARSRPEAHLQPFLQTAVGR